MALDFRLLNVFALPDSHGGADAGAPLTGNPLCVFTDARGLTGEQQQALALQFNLSETTFVLPAEEPGVTARVRIFTPSYEMPFAGHPTLGTAHVVRELAGCGDSVVLRMQAGDIPVTADPVSADTGTDRTSTRWTLTANPPTTTPAAGIDDLAAAIGLPPSAFAGTPLWVDTGSRQLVVPLRTVDDVRSLALDTALMAHHARRRDGESMVYAWAPDGEGGIEARMLFSQSGSFREDPATGSACANLGGWLLVNGASDDSWIVRQGAQAGRPSELHLNLTDGVIRVGGLVTEVGRGTFAL